MRCIDGCPICSREKHFCESETMKLRIAYACSTSSPPHPEFDAAISHTVEFVRRRAGRKPLVTVMRTVADEVGLLPLAKRLAYRLLDRGSGNHRREARIESVGDLLIEVGALHAAGQCGRVRERAVIKRCEHVRRGREAVKQFIRN